MPSGLEYWTKKFENTEMLPENHNLIKGHIRNIKNIGLREHTILNHLESLIQFGSWCKILIVDLRDDDIYNYHDYLDSLGYKHGTKYSKLATIKSFLKDVNPQAAQAIKIKMQRNKKLPEDLLNREDIERLIDCCGNARDRAIIAFLYESGCRKGELFGINIKNVIFDEYGAVVTFPEGKTGARRIRIVYSASYLRAWLDVHPNKSRDSPLFVSFREPYPVLSGSGLVDQLNKLAKKAGIEKPINPHAFRHAAATQLAEHLTEQQLKNYLGWTAGSNMASVYVHLSGAQIDSAILKLHGIEVNEKENTLKVTKCPRCKELNPDRADYCFKCNLPLKEPLKFENELEEVKKRLEMVEKDRNQIQENFKQLSEYFP